MTFRPALAPVLVAALLAGCGTDTTYLTAPTAAEQQVALRVGSIEVQDMVLPDYAEAPEIMIEGADGGLKPIKGAVWGNMTARGVSAQLVESLGARTTAKIAAEPWPLTDYPDATLQVRVDRILARADGSFVFSGQYAVASPDRKLREFIERFAISVPLAGASPGAIAQAKGAALDQLADQIVARLR